MFNNLSRFPSATPVSPYSPAALFLPLPRKGICPSHPVWQKLDNMINEFFDGITLADLIQTAPQ